MYACVLVFSVLVLLFKTQYFFFYRLMELYQKKNDKLLKKALFVVSSLTPWPVKKP